jgi:hypothetical protein
VSTYAFFESVQLSKLILVGVIFEKLQILVIWISTEFGIVQQCSKSNMLIRRVSQFTRGRKRMFCVSHFPDKITQNLVDSFLLKLRYVMYIEV